MLEKPQEEIDSAITNYLTSHFLFLVLLLYLMQLWSVSWI